MANLSFLIVRTDVDEIKCYRNACLHRARRLRDTHGKGAKNLRCLFHGWNWNLDGSLKEIPCQWDFPSVDMAEYHLPETAVGVWQGFVFINPDRDAEPLEDFLEGLADHFTGLPFDRKYKAAHVAKVLRCNWKVCQEAFMEAYHVIATHPTLMLDLGDANSRYDVYKNFSRAISPHGVESPHLANMVRHDRITDAKMFTRYQHPITGFIYERVEDGEVKVTDLDGHESTFTDDSEWIDGPITQADPHLCKWVGGEMGPGTEDALLPIPSIPDGVSIRAYAAEQRRSQIRQTYGDLIDVDAASDAELIDAIFYSVFPNWSPWGSSTRSTTASARTVTTPTKRSSRSCSSELVKTPKTRLLPQRSTGSTSTKTSSTRRSSARWQRCSSRTCSTCRTSSGGYMPKNNRR